MDQAPLLHLLLLLLSHQPLPPFQCHLPTPSLPMVGTTHDGVVTKKSQQGVRAGKAQNDGTAPKCFLLPPTPITLACYPDTSQCGHCGHCQGNWAAPLKCWRWRPFLPRLMGSTYKSSRVLRRKKDTVFPLPGVSVGPGDNLAIKHMHFSLLVSPKRLAKGFLAVASD